MAEITLSGAVHYRYGQEYSVRLVGCGLESGSPFSLVARYTFTAPRTGARHLALSFTGWYVEVGSKIPLRFFIGTDPEGYEQADTSYPYSGELTIQSDGTTMAGTADILLLPGKTYYLWLFPGSGELGYYGWLEERIVGLLDASGAAGGARIGEDKKLYLAAIGQPDGSKKLYLPCVYDTSSGKWKLQS